MGFTDTLLRFFGDPRPQDFVTDLRSPEQRGMIQNTAAEYSRAAADPSYGMLSPADQRYQEQELARSVKNRTGAAGSGGSGYESDLVRKAIVDFRINQMAQRQRTLDTLRQGVLQSQGLQMGSPQPGIARGLVTHALSRGVDSLFNEPDPGGSQPGDTSRGNRYADPRDNGGSGGGSGGMRVMGT
jgi:hypothetical protein